MHVFLDRNLCTRNSGCEICFATHLRCQDFQKATCLVSAEEDERAETIFHVQDRDGSIKSLVVKPENINEALTSWIWLWESQSGPII